MPYMWALCGYGHGLHVPRQPALHWRNMKILVVARQLACIYQQLQWKCFAQQCDVLHAMIHVVHVQHSIGSSVAIQRLPLRAFTPGNKAKRCSRAFFCCTLGELTRTLGILKKQLV